METGRLGMTNHLATTFYKVDSNWFIKEQEPFDSFLKAQEWLSHKKEDGVVGIIFCADGYDYPQFGDITPLVKPFYLHLR